MLTPTGQFASRTAKVTLLFSGQALSALSGLIITMVVSRQFDYRDYGTFKQVLLCFSMAGQILAMGMPMALYYFLPIPGRQPKATILENVLILALLGTAFALFLWLGGAKLTAAQFGNPSLAWALSLLAPYGAVVLLRSVVAPCLMSANKPGVLAVYNAASRAGECLVVVVSVVAWHTLGSALGATGLAALVSTSVGLALGWRAYKRDLATPSFAGASAQLKYGVVVGLAQTIAVVFDNVDQVVLSSWASPEVFAIYANGALKLPILGMFVMAVTTVMLPELVKLHQSTDKAGMLKLWQSAMVKTSYIAFPTALLMGVLAEDFICVLFSEKYLASTPIFRIFLLALPFQMISYGPMFIASNRNLYTVLINTIAVFVHILLLLAVVPVYGGIGAAVCTVVSEICVRIGLHIYFIGRIVEAPARSVIPVTRLLAIAGPAVVLSLPLFTRFLFDSGTHLILLAYGGFYFVACYIWYTRRGDAPRVVLAERAWRWLCQRCGRGFSL